MFADDTTISTAGKEVYTIVDVIIGPGDHCELAQEQSATHQPFKDKLDLISTLVLQLQQRDREMRHHLRKCADTYRWRSQATWGHPWQSPSIRIPHPCHLQKCQLEDTSHQSPSSTSALNLPCLSCSSSPDSITARRSSSIYLTPWLPISWRWSTSRIFFVLTWPSLISLTKHAKHGSLAKNNTLTNRITSSPSFHLLAPQHGYMLILTWLN